MQKFSGQFPFCLRSFTLALREGLSFAKIVDIAVVHQPKWRSINRFVRVK